MRLLALLFLWAVAAASQDISALRAPARGWIHQAKFWSAAPATSQSTDEEIHPLVIQEDTVSLFETEWGQRIALIPVITKDASATKLHFDEFRAFDGAAVYLYGFDGVKTHLAGVYRGAGPLHSGEFWSDPVPGELAVVEVHLPAGSAALPFTIREVAALSRFEPLAPPARAAAVLDRGDILVEPGAKDRERSGLGYNIANRLWPGGIVPYTIDSDLRNAQRIRDAVQHWNEKLSGSIRIQPRVNESAYIEFVQADPAVCSSYVGRLGMAGQPVNIGDYCGVGNVIHEIGHALGLQHEQNRRDRDSRVRVMRENIDPTALINFDLDSTADLLGVYDYGSIMHYGAYAFSTNGAPTIITIPEGITIGQRTALSAGDIAAVRRLYPAAVTGTAPSTVKVSLSSNPSGRTLVVDGQNIVAPATREWVAGTVHTVLAPDNLVSSGKYSFATWSDGGAQEHPFVTPAASATLLASFAMNYTVTATPSIAGRGTVSISPEDSDGYYPRNTPITVSATPANGFCFSGWTGTLALSDPSIRLTVTRAYRITAAFQSGSVTAPQRYEATSEAQTISISVSATSGCIWKATSDTDWISIQNPTGKSSAVLKVKLAANFTNSPRTGEIVINGNRLTVGQTSPSVRDRS